MECLPCTLRQVLEASRMATDSVELQEKIMQEAIELLADYQTYRNSPEVARDMHKIVKKYTGIPDPYQDVKLKNIHMALDMYPQLSAFLDQKEDRLYWALKIAATGNVLDSAINTDVDFDACAEAELARPFSVCDIDKLTDKLRTAKTLLVIGDNAGETVFDRILLNELSYIEDITYAVRSGPVINDATVEDAVRSGLDAHAAVISTGCNVPGVILDECSRDFLEIYDHADVVISKGQGNYETLSDEDREIFFLLKAKCPVLSGLLDVRLNDYIFKYHDGKKI